MFDVEVMVSRPGATGWSADMVTGSRTRALRRREYLYARIGRHGLGGVRVVDDAGVTVYPERWER